MVSYNTASGHWDHGYARVPFDGRAYHTATYVDEEVIVVGGSTFESVCGDVWAFKPKHRSWRQLDFRWASASCLLQPWQITTLCALGTCHTC